MRKRIWIILPFLIGWVGMHFILTGCGKSEQEKYNEMKAAEAQAQAASQPQPTAEPTVEPTPEPTKEPSHIKIKVFSGNALVATYIADCDPDDEFENCVDITNGVVSFTSGG